MKTINPKFNKTERTVFKISSKGKVISLTLFIVMLLLVAILNPSESPKSNPISNNSPTAGVSLAVETLIRETSAVSVKAQEETTVKSQEEWYHIQDGITIPNSLDEDHMMYTTTAVHLRSEPNGESLRVLPLGYVIVAYNCPDVDDWSYVSWDSEDGGNGWIKSEYLRDYRALEYTDIPLEHYHQDWVRDLLETYDLDVDEYLIYGMMYVENRFNSVEESYAGAQGIMQVMPKTWEILYQEINEKYPEVGAKIVDDPTDKFSNIAIGIYCLKYLAEENKLDSVENNISRILTCYNRGTGGANSYFNTYGTYSSSYSQDVLRAAEYIRTSKTWKEGM